MAKLVLLSCILAVAFVSKANAYSKRWIWSTTWNDPKNWDKQSLPCSKDSIILSEGVIHLDRNLSISNIALSTNGEIVLDESIEITFGTGDKSTDKKNCQGNGKVVTFTGNQPKDWFNPLNWNFIENDRVASWSDGSLYMDRIPCKTDQVSFQQGDAFAVSLKAKAEVSEIFIGKRSVADFPTFLASKAGQLRFKVADGGSLTTNKNTCNQKFGCPCGYASMKDMICSKFECPPVCENKVKPEGDCCERCGALVKMNLNPTFTLDSCQSTLRSYLAKTEFKAATLVISPIMDGNAVERAQILVTDKADGKIAVGGARATLSYLQKTKELACAVFDAKVETSTKGGDGGKSGKSTGAAEESSTIALAVTLTLVAVLVILAAMYLLYRRKYGSFIINKQTLHNEMDISGSHTVEMVDTKFSGQIVDYDGDIEIPGKFGASFENPMYDELQEQSGPAVIEPQISPEESIEAIQAKPIKKKKKKTTEKGATSKAKDKKTGGDAFENPLYSEFPQDFTESYDPDYHVPVTDDSGFQNPLYSDLYANEDGSVEEVQGKLPPSFLDTIGFTPEDMDEAINANSDLHLDFGKGESEA